MRLVARCDTFSMRSKLIVMDVVRMMQEKGADALSVAFDERTEHMTIAHTRSDTGTDKMTPRSTSCRSRSCLSAAT